MAISFDSPRVVRKVLYVIGHLQTGGAQRQLFNLASNLDRARFAPEVAAFQDGPMSSEFLSKGIKVSIFPKRLRPLRYDPTPLFPLIRLLASGGHSVVHTFMFSANMYGRISALAGLGSRSRPVLVASERSIEERSRPAWAVNRWLSGRGGAMVVNSFALKQHLAHTGKFDEKEIRVINNGIDLTRFSPLMLASSSTSEEPRFVCPARITPGKGQLELLDALAILRDKGIFAQLTIIGDSVWPDEKAYHELLIKRVSALGLAGRVSFVNNSTDIRPYLRGATATVLPSKSEAFPNVLLESMACGVPVVATKVGGITEMVEDEVSGLLVEPDSAELLARALQRMCSGKELRARLSEAGIERANRFPIDVMVSATEALYEHLLAERSAGSSKG